MRGLLGIPARCIPQLTPYAATRVHHPLKLKCIFSRTDLHRNSFLPRSICTWNDLNNHSLSFVLSSSSIDLQKGRCIPHKVLICKSVNTLNIDACLQFTRTLNVLSNVRA